MIMFKKPTNQLNDFLTNQSTTQTNKQYGAKSLSRS